MAKTFITDNNEYAYVLGWTNLYIYVSSEVFDDAANQLMGISAKYPYLLATESTSAAEIVQRICKKQLLLTLSIRTDMFSGNACLKVVIVMVENTSSTTSLDT